MRYESYPHTADTAIIAYGTTLHEVFENAAFGMFDMMFDLSAVSSGVSRPVLAAGDTVEDLLVRWLSEVLFVAEVHDLALCWFVVDRLEEGGVQGSVGGSAAGDLSLRGAPIKAVTYHDLAVVEIPDGWWARVVFDV